MTGRESFILKELPDPVTAALGISVRAPYVEEAWLPLLGPASVLLIRRFGLLLEVSDESEVNLEQLARALGMWGTQAGSSRIEVALKRLSRYGFIADHGAIVRARRFAPRLTSHQQERLAALTPTAPPQGV